MSLQHPWFCTFYENGECICRKDALCVMCEITGLENQEMCHKCRVKWA